MNISYINTVRALAIITVVGIHVAGPALYQPMNANWWTGNIIASLSRIRVPLFLMISGALLLHKDEPVRIFFKKRFSKILIPFLFWSAFYYIYQIRSGLDMNSFIKVLLGNGIMYHLWYFYLIIPLYLLIPLLRKIVKHIPVQYILVYALIASSIVTLSGLLGLFETSLTIYTNPFSGGVAYLLLGYAITHKDMKVHFLSLYAIISVLAIILGTYWLSIYTGGLNVLLYEGFGLPVMIYAIAVFTFIKNKQKDVTSNSRFVSLLSTYSFGIYLLHPYLLIKVQEIVMDFPLLTKIGLIDQFVTLTATMVTCSLTVFIISKIKWLNRII